MKVKCGLKADKVGQRIRNKLKWEQNNEISFETGVEGLMDESESGDEGDGEMMGEIKIGDLLTTNGKKISRESREPEWPHLNLFNRIKWQ